MKYFLPLNLQLFADGEEDVDIDALLSDFESEWEDTDDDASDDNEDQTDDSQEDTDDSQDEQTDSNDKEGQANPNDEDADRRNRAFADLRREAESNKKYAEFISKLAEQGGTTPDELLARYEQMQLQQQAEEKGIPVEFLQRQNTTESELASIKEQLAAERLEKQADVLKSKYGATDEDLKSTFQYMFESGIDPMKAQVDFEKFYRAANLDSIIQKEIESARQKDLEDKKNRQEGAAIPNGSSANQQNGDLSDEDVDKMLEKMGIRI